jgi:hypothetical protein
LFFALSTPIDLGAISQDPKSQQMTPTQLKKLSTIADDEDELSNARTEHSSAVAEQSDSIAIGVRGSLSRSHSHDDTLTEPPPLPPLPDLPPSPQITRGQDTTIIDEPSPHFLLSPPPLSPNSTANQLHGSVDSIPDFLAAPPPLSLNEASSKELASDIDLGDDGDEFDEFDMDFNDKVSYV